MRARAWVVAAVALAAAPPSRAAVCDGIPECQEQVQSPITLDAFQTKGWAFYCSGDHPFYWNWEKSGTAVSVVEDPFGETGNPTKLDVTMTNWDPFGSHAVTITMACSTVNQDGPSNCQSGPQIGDPRCPTVSGSQHNFCSGGPVPACIQVWQEQCSDGTQYYCTDDQTLVSCIQCS